MKHGLWCIHPVHASTPRRAMKFKAKISFRGQREKKDFKMPGMAARWHHAWKNHLWIRSCLWRIEEKCVGANHSSSVPRLGVPSSKLTAVILKDKFYGATGDCYKRWFMNQTLHRASGVAHWGQRDFPRQNYGVHQLQLVEILFLALRWRRK